MQLQQSTLFCSRDSCWITDSWLLSSQQIADHRWKVSSRLILSVVVVNLERQTRARLVGISKKVKFVFLASSFVCLWDCVWFLCRYECTFRDLRPWEKSHKISSANLTFLTESRVVSCTSILRTHQLTGIWNSSCLMFARVDKIAGYRLRKKRTSNLLSQAR